MCTGNRQRIMIQFEIFFSIIPTNLDVWNQFENCLNYSPLTNMRNVVISVFCPCSGPRLCPGKLLSNTVISSILTDVIQDFTLHLPPDHNFSLKGNPGIIYNPQPFSIIAKQRTSWSTDRNREEHLGWSREIVLQVNTFLIYSRLISVV